MFLNLDPHVNIVSKKKHLGTVENFLALIT